MTSEEEPRRVIPATPYSREIPIRNETRDRMTRVAARAQEWWDNRPSLTEMALRLHLQYIPIAVIAGALAVATTDEALDLHLADRAAAVQPDPHSNEIVQLGQEVIHQIGVEAKDLEDDN